MMIFFLTFFFIFYILLTILYILFMAALTVRSLFNCYVFCTIYQKTGGNFWTPFIPFYGYHKYLKQFNVNFNLLLSLYISMPVLLVTAILSIYTALFFLLYFLIIIGIIVISTLLMISLNESIRLSFRKNGVPMDQGKFWIGYLFCSQSLTELVVNENYKYVPGQNKNAFLHDENFKNDNHPAHTTTIDDIFGGNDE